MSCGCNTEKERFFGRFPANSGIMQKIIEIGESWFKGNFQPTDYHSVPIEKGNTGVRYSSDANLAVPLYMQKSYTGILPIKEQPLVDSPLPYRIPVL